MSKRDDPWMLRPPLRLDGVGEEVPRPCDLVVCPRCLAVRYIGRAQFEVRTKPGFSGEKVRGVFCPGCDQLLFDENSWTDHLADRKVYDRGKESERAKRLGPPQVGAVEVGDSEGADAILIGADDARDQDKAVFDDSETV
jgi:hypothetical protein